MREQISQKDGTCILVPPMPGPAVAVVVACRALMAAVVLLLGVCLLLPWGLWGRPAAAKCSCCAAVAPIDRLGGRFVCSTSTLSGGRDGHFYAKGSFPYTLPYIPIPFSTK